MHPVVLVIGLLIGAGFIRLVLGAAAALITVKGLWLVGTLATFYCAGWWGLVPLLAVPPALEALSQRAAKPSA